MTTALFQHNNARLYFEVYQEVPVDESEQIAATVIFRIFKNLVRGLQAGYPKSMHLQRSRAERERCERIFHQQAVKPKKKFT